MKTECGDMMREVLVEIHKMFASDSLRDGPFYVIRTELVQDGFVVCNYGWNRGGNMSKFLAYKSGWYTEPETWFFRLFDE